MRGSILACRFRRMLFCSRCSWPLGCVWPGVVSGEERRAISFHASRLTPHASRFTAVAGVVVACGLIAFAVVQEEEPRRPESIAEAKERLLSRPSKASYHLSVLRRVGDKASLDWQLNEYKAALWIQPKNPYLRDKYAAALMAIGRTEERLKEISQSVAESPSLNTHDYLSAESLPELSAAERGAVEEGFKRAVARGYPGALPALAEFYARLNRFVDQAALYEDAAGKETDNANKAELLIKGGLAYLKEAGSREHEANRKESREQGAGSKEQRAKSKAQRTTRQTQLAPNATTR